MKVEYKTIINPKGSNLTVYPHVIRNKEREHVGYDGLVIMGKYREEQTLQEIEQALTAKFLELHSVIHTKSEVSKYIGHFDVSSLYFDPIAAGKTVAYAVKTELLNGKKEVDINVTLRFGAEKESIHEDTDLSGILRVSLSSEGEAIPDVGYKLTGDFPAVDCSYNYHTACKDFRGDHHSIHLTLSGYALEPLFKDKDLDDGERISSLVNHAVSVAKEHFLRICHKNNTEVYGIQKSTAVIDQLREVIAERYSDWKKAKENNPEYQFKAGVAIDMGFTKDYKYGCFIIGTKERIEDGNDSIERLLVSREAHHGMKEAYDTYLKRLDELGVTVEEEEDPGDSLSELMKKLLTAGMAGRLTAGAVSLPMSEDSEDTPVPTVEGNKSVH